MDKKPLPIQVVLPRKEDFKKVKGMGNKKMMGPFTDELRQNTASQFNKLIEYFDKRFDEYPNVPCIGKVIMKEKAIAKTHKPTRLLSDNNCPIIGAGKMDEIYIKVTRRGVKHTVEEILNSETEDLKVNITKIDKIEPYTEYDILNSYDIQTFYDYVTKNKKAMKIKLFDYDNEIENFYCRSEFEKLIAKLNLDENINQIEYTDRLIAYKLECYNLEKIKEILRFSGIKSISFFPSYSSAPTNNNQSNKLNLEDLPDPQEGKDYPIIGIIDSGIKKGHKYLEKWIYAREEFVPNQFQNNTHGTFVAGVLEYGHILNSFEPRETMFKIVDVVALPNSDPEYGLTDEVDEETFMEIIRKVVEKYKDVVKIWNISMTFGEECNPNYISDIAVFIDKLLDEYREYNIDIILSAGNYEEKPFRTWPPNKNLMDNIEIPADSVKSIVVGSIAHKKGCGCVEENYPSPFSRKGPAPNYVVKPDLVDYGGNCSCRGEVYNCGILSFDECENIVSDSGTSFATARVSGVYGHLRNCLVYNHSNELSKALLIHSAKNPIKEEPINKLDSYYLGFGKPKGSIDEVLYCDKSNITLIFQSEIYPSTIIDINNFPYPESLYRNGKWHGEIKMTLVYSPPLDERFGQEYCGTNIEVSMGTVNYNTKKGKYEFKGQVPIEAKWDKRYERECVENGFKWCPIKCYNKKIVKGIQGEWWKLHIECHTRSGVVIQKQPFVLIITISDPHGGDIYTETINYLRERGFVYNDLKIQNRIKQKYNI